MTKYIENNDNYGYKILNILREYLIDNPEVRFTQALHNLGINEFANKANPEQEKHQLRDPYNDTDQMVLERIKKALNTQ